MVSGGRTEAKRARLRRHPKPQVSRWEPRCRRRHAASFRRCRAISPPSVGSDTSISAGSRRLNVLTPGLRERPGGMLLFHPLPGRTTNSVSRGEVAEWQTRTVQVRVPERA